MLNWIRKNKWIFLALFFITLAGIFLRTYRFRQSLVFSGDQVRDLRIVRNVVENKASWPLLGPDMSDGQGFDLGPVYYYFQIINAKIFGVGQKQQAYPEVFFSVLSIGLLYYFLSRYFSQKASVLSVCIYAVSYFDIQYSRFAWNVNLIPFFTLLFLVSLWHFLIEDERVSWKWICLIGFSFGVSIQLHAIVLLLFFAIISMCFIFLFFIKKKRAVWKFFLVIFLITAVLNSGQIISERKTNFANFKNFKKAFVLKTNKVSLKKEFVLDIACNAQANAHAISSLGNKRMCNFLYDDHLQDSSYSTPLSLNKSPMSLVGEIIGLIFSILGMYFLIFYFKKEKDKNKKYFLGMILLYEAIYFLIMLPVVPGSRMRYYLEIIFMPFIFVSFMVDYITEKYPRRGNWLIIAGVIFLVVINLLMVYFKLFYPKHFSFGI